MPNDIARGDLVPDWDQGPVMSQVIISPEGGIVVLDDDKVLLPGLAGSIIEPILHRDDNACPGRCDRTPDRHDEVKGIRRMPFVAPLTIVALDE
jgi:hypothetical protein